MKKIITVLLAAAMVTPLAACSAQQSGNNGGQQETAAAQTEMKSAQTENDRETIYQVALLQSLTQGYYDGIIKVSELKKQWTVDEPITADCSGFAASSDKCGSNWHVVSVSDFSDRNNERTRS